MYINDLPAAINDMNSHLYADDVQVYRSCKLSDISACVLRINQTLCQINNWALNNGLSLNPKKSQVLVIARKPIDTAVFPEIKIGALA